MFWRQCQLVERLWGGRKRYFPTIYSMVINRNHSSQACGHSLTSWRRDGYQHKDFVSQLVPKTTGAPALAAVVFSKQCLQNTLWNVVPGPGSGLAALNMLFRPKKRVRPTLAPKVAVFLGDLKRFKATLGKFPRNVMRFKATLGDLRRLKATLGDFKDATRTHYLVLVCTTQVE